MKDHFPFTDYDFYAYLASGGLLLAVIDYIFNAGAVLTQPDWSFGQIVLAVAGSYVLGHIVAMLAQTTLETSLIGSLFAKPMDIQLGTKQPRFHEKMLGKMVGRYYEPMKSVSCQNTLQKAATKLSCEVTEITEGESVFLLGFKDSFADEKLRHRIDGFRNQYGFCRNVAFVALVASLLLVWSACTNSMSLHWWLAAVSFLIFVAMFTRFMKFLATFQAEVIRALN